MGAEAVAECWSPATGHWPLERPDGISKLECQCHYVKPFWLPRSCVGARAGAPRPAPRPDAERPPGIPTRSVGTRSRAVGAELNGITSALTQV